MSNFDTEQSVKNKLIIMKRKKCINGVLLPFLSLNYFHTQAKISHVWTLMLFGCKMGHFKPLWKTVVCSHKTFCPLLKKFFRQPIPENSLRMPIWNFYFKLILIPSHSTFMVRKLLRESFGALGVLFMINTLHTRK